MQGMRRAVDRVLEWALVALMAANVLNVLWQVFTRFVLRDPSSWTEELARYLLIWVGLLGAAYASGRGKHLGIDVFVNRLPARARGRVLFLGRVLIGLFALAVMTAGGLRLVWITFALDQVSASLQMRLGYLYLVLPLSGLLIAFYAVCDMAAPGAGPGVAGGFDPRGAAGSASGGGE